MMGAMAASRLCGGQYTLVSSVYSSVADITAGWSPDRRARVMSVVAGFQWLGLTAGPALGGQLSDWLGTQESMVMPALLNVGFGLLCLVLMQETLAKKTPFLWRRANTFNSLRIMFTNSVVLRLGQLWRRSLQHTRTALTQLLFV